MTTYPILNAIAQKDWNTATTAVTAALQQKVSQHLAQERVQVGRGLVKESAITPAKFKKHNAAISQLYDDAYQQVADKAKWQDKDFDRNFDNEVDTIYGKLLKSYLSQHPEAKSVLKEDTDIQPGDNVRTKMGGQTRGVVTKVEDGQVFFQIDDPYAKYGPRVLKAPLSNIIKEDALPITDIQRIYDETGSISETETLCNVTKLIVNTSGEVVSYVQPDPLKESHMLEGAYGLTRMQVQNAFNRFMASGYGLNQAIRNTERECDVSGIQLSSDGKTVAYYHDHTSPHIEEFEGRA